MQDAAAALPARLFGDVAGKQVADLCAAPGGKTAQLAQAGARVTALDRSANRLVRVRDNLGRLGLHADMIATDVTEWQGGPFDAVLVDAPCSSTGTIRRHPDVGWLKSETDIAQLVGLQRRLLDRAVGADPAWRARSSIASARSNPRKASSRSRRCSRARQACAASRSAPMSFPASPSSSPRRATCARFPATGAIRSRAWAASMASSPPVWSGFNASF